MAYLNDASPAALSSVWKVLDSMRGRVSAAELFDSARLSVAAYVASLMAKSAQEPDAAELLEATPLSPEARAAVLEMLTGVWMEIARSLADRVGAEDLEQCAIACTSARMDRFPRAAVEFSTSGSIVKLASAILDVRPGDSVADLGCGWGGFLACAAQDAPGASLVGVELNRGAFAVASIRMELLGTGARVVWGDAFGFSPEARFDKVFSQFPLGMRFSGLSLQGTPYQDEFGGFASPMGRPQSADWAFARRLCDALAPGGRAVSIMTNGAAFNYGDCQARKYFLERGLVEAVVALPGSLLYGTAVPTTLVVFGNGGGPVRLVDATDLSVHGVRVDSMGPDEVAEVLKRLNGDGPSSKTVGLSELAEKEYVLTPERYLAKPVAMENPTPLGDLAVAIERGAMIKSSELFELTAEGRTGISYLTVGNIEDGRVGANLPSLRELDPKLEDSCIRHGDLVITKTGRPLKVAVAEVPDGEKVLASGNLYAVRLDPERIDPYFAAAFFASAEGQEVVGQRMAGTAIPTLSLRGLQKVELPLPPLEEQRRIASRYQAALDQVEIHKSMLAKARAAVEGAYSQEVQD